MAADGRENAAGLVVRRPVADLWARPASGAGRVSQILLGAPLVVVAHAEGFLYVEGPDRYRGWIRRDDTCPPPDAAGEARLVGELLAALYAQPCPPVIEAGVVLPARRAASTAEAARSAGDPPPAGQSVRLGGGSPAGQAASAAGAARAAGGSPAGQAASAAEAVRAAGGSPAAPALPAAPVACGEVTFSTRVVVIETAGDWCRVRLPEGSAWMRAAGLRAVPAPGAPLCIETLLADARRLLGVPYLWGGASARGTDCSAYVQMLFRMQGRELRRDAHLQTRHGRPVPAAALRPGDLLFFGHSRRGTPTHVGLSLGEGRYIHAHDSGEHCVGISALADALADGTFWGARRME